MGILIANIFIKTWITGEKSFIAMESRGYDGLNENNGQRYFGAH